MLQKNERFQEEIKKYKTAIEKINDDKQKLEANKLLNNLIFEVRNMDSMYLDMVYAKQLPSLGNEFREKINDLRKQLNNKLKL